MKLSLRWSISILFVASVLLVTLLSTAYSVSQASDGVRSSIVERQQKSGTGAASGLGYFLDTSRQSLSSTAALIPASDLRAPTRTNIGPLLDPLIAINREFSAVALLDAEGHPLILRPQAAPPPAAGFASNPTFARTLSTGTPSLSVDANVGAPFWIVRVPASAPGLSPHYLFGRLSVYFMEDILFSNLEPSSIGVFLDPSEHIIASTNPDYQGALFAQWTPLRRIQDGAPYSEGESPADGRDVIVTSTSLEPRHPVSVAIMSPKTQLTSLQAALIRSAALTGAILALPALLFGLVATNVILRPVREVRAATHRMRQGDLAVRARPHGATEFRELAQDFNAMATTLAGEWEQRVKLQNHLEELVKERTQQLNQRQEDMEMFFYGVSHDFKSPVISISNITQMLDEGLALRRIDRAALRNFTRRIRSSSTNLQGLIGELLEFAQAERVAPKYSTINTRDLFAPLMDEAQNLASSQGIRVESVGRDFNVETDAGRVRHVVANLLQNAIKYMPEKAKAWVRLEWTRGRGNLVVRVTDNGDGIPEELRPNLFRPFSRPSGGTRKGGHGLGLSIVKRLTESLRGTVELETKRGSGSAFTLRIPLRRPVADGRRAP